MEKTLRERFQGRTGPSRFRAPAHGEKSERVSESLRVRVSRREKAELAEIARDTGLSLSSYVRRVVLSRAVPPRRAPPSIPEVNRQTYLELGRIGSDLNEMAQSLSEGAPGDPRWQQALMEALELLAGALAELRPHLLGAHKKEADK